MRGIVCRNKDIYEQCNLHDRQTPHFEYYIEAELPREFREDYTVKGGTNLTVSFRDKHYDIFSSHVPRK